MMMYFGLSGEAQAPLLRSQLDIHQLPVPALASCPSGIATSIMISRKSL